MAHRVRALVVALAVSVAAPAAAQPAFDLRGAKAERVFFVLGMLFEYGGAPVIQGNGTIQTLFCNERDVVPLFTRVLASLAKEQGLPADLRTEARQSCLTAVSSPSIAARLGDYYPRHSGPLDLALFAAPGARLDPKSGTIGPQDLDRRRALAYVAGAWARYRHDGAILLAAGKSKADLVAVLLKALGCANVRVMTTVDAAPGSSTVSFEPTPEVSTWLNKSW